MLLHVFINIYTSKKNHSGETSAGKSTLINKILEKNIFKGKVLESTSTICKIRNSDRIRVISEKVTGEKEEQDFTAECNLSSEEGVKMLRDFLEKRTDLTCMSSDENIRSVDIGFPIHFLEVNYTYPCHISTKCIQNCIFVLTVYQT